eukprot:COSAG04_NODE_346_length_16127_cov_10.497442_14_plen_356_part_00
MAAAPDRRLLRCSRRAARSSEAAAGHRGARADSAPSTPKPRHRRGRRTPRRSRTGAGCRRALRRLEGGRGRASGPPGKVATPGRWRSRSTRAMWAWEHAPGPPCEPQRRPKPVGPQEGEGGQGAEGAHVGGSGLALRLRLRLRWRFLFLFRFLCFLCPFFFLCFLPFFRCFLCLSLRLSCARGLPLRLRLRLRPLLPRLPLRLRLPLPERPRLRERERRSPPAAIGGTSSTTSWRANPTGSNAVLGAADVVDTGVENACKNAGRQHANVFKPKQLYDIRPLDPTTCPSSSCRPARRRLSKPPSPPRAAPCKHQPRPSSPGAAESAARMEAAHRASGSPRPPTTQKYWSSVPIPTW